MPVAFRRSSFAKLRGKVNYYISEKTDGVRYMMLLSAEGVWLTDRKHEFFFVNGMKEVAATLASRDYTLLDGEIVQQRRTRRAMFMIFDILSVNGDCVAKHPLNTRLKIIGELIGKYRGQGLHERNQHYTLIGKVFESVSPDGIGSLRRNIIRVRSYV